MGCGSTRIGSTCAKFVPTLWISGADGSFRIADVPAGTYTLSVWHEALGTQTKDVTIKGDEEVRVLFELTAKKK